MAKLEVKDADIRFAAADAPTKSTKVDDIHSDPNLEPPLVAEETDTLNDTPSKSQPDASNPIQTSSQETKKTDRLAVSKDVITIITLVTGLITGIYQFWYVNVYTANNAPPSVSLTASASFFKSLNSNTDTYILTVNINNSGKSRVYIKSGFWNATCIKYGEANLSDKQYSKQLQDAADGKNGMGKNYWSANYRFGRVGKWMLVAGARFAPDGVWVEPSQSFSFQSLIFVPRHKFTHMRTDVMCICSREPDAVVVHPHVSADGQIDPKIAYKDGKWFLRGYGAKEFRNWSRDHGVSFVTTWTYTPLT